MRNIFVLFAFVFTVIISAQELNCSVVVNAQLTGREDQQIYKTLEKQINEFVNKTKWTKKEFTTQERINCSFVININEFSGENYQASIQVQASRPVYGSTYSSPIYSVNDKDFAFRYLEFQNMVYNPNQFESNLISVLAFHVYMILGLDADSFEQGSGDEYFKQAQQITNYSQQENFKGWKLEDGLQSRFALIDNMLSPTYKEYRDVMYNYHRKGLDQMSTSAKAGKNEIAEALNAFQVMNRRRPNSYILRTFFDAKADEIEQIFTDGPSVDISNLIDVLNRVAPMHSSKWRNIKY
ncbi:type IX secretion system protein PorD [Lacinutrix salivirga]